MNNISLILPTCGDPLVLYLWFENYKKIRHFFDDIFVSVDFNDVIKDGSGDIDTRVIDENIRIYKNFIQFHKNLFKLNGVNNFIFMKGTQHGINIRNLLTTFKKDLKNTIFITEEDDYIINVDAFESQLKKFKNDNYDIIAPRLKLSVSPEWDTFFVSELKSNVNLNVENHKNEPFSYWPCNFLIKKQHIFETNLHFEAKDYLKGSDFKLHNNIFKLQQDFSLDTFREFTFETLRNKKIHNIELTDSSLRGSYSESIVCMERKNCLNSFIDYHLSGTSVFFSNKFWMPTFNLNGPYAMEEIKTRNYNDINELTCLSDYYRTCKILYTMMLHKGPSEFEFYENYKLNMEIFIDLCENRVTSFINTVDSRSEFGVKLDFINKLNRNIF